MSLVLMGNILEKKCGGKKREDSFGRNNERSAEENNNYVTIPAGFLKTFSDC